MEAFCFYFWALPKTVKVDVACLVWGRPTSSHPVWPPVTHWSFTSGKQFVWLTLDAGQDLFLTCYLPSLAVSFAWNMEEDLLLFLDFILGPSCALKNYLLWFTWAPLLLSCTVLIHIFVISDLVLIFSAAFLFMIALYYNQFLPF